MKCDFCSSPHATTEYPANSFEVSELHAGSDGSWAACSACASLIERGDRAGLALRTIESLHASVPEFLADIVIDWQRVAVDVTILHGNFYKNRTGVARPITVA